ncbi:protein FAM107B [Cynoglossus semilaevis]|uniref:protein FAM107B n=1 Tax=Cynoglossus semilaevis TaxID=244447 RepID=UPI0007DCB669|nr:protein FAM107B-like [Cynoglossus semilaevis]
MNYWTSEAEGHQRTLVLTLYCHTADGRPNETLQARKLDTPSQKTLHRELLLRHKRGLLLEEKPELKRVLEQRRLELHKENDLAQRRPSDLEMELCKRQQKLQQYEQEEIRQRENLQKIPEFVRVKDNLRRTQTFEQ